MTDCVCVDLGCLCMCMNVCVYLCVHGHLCETVSAYMSWYTHRGQRRASSVGLHSPWVRVPLYRQCRDVVCAPYTQVWCMCVSEDRRRSLMPSFVTASFIPFRQTPLLNLELAWLPPRPTDPLTVPQQRLSPTAHRITHQVFYVVQEVYLRSTGLPSQLLSC